MCYGVVESKDNIVQDNDNQVIVSRRGIDMESITIIQLFMNHVCLFMINHLVQGPPCLVTVTILFPNAVLDLFPGSIRVPICISPVHSFSFCRQANAGQPLLFIVGLCDDKLIIHLKDLSLQVLYMTMELCRWWGFSCHYFQMVAVLSWARWKKGNISHMS